MVLSDKWIIEKISVPKLLCLLCPALILIGYLQNTGAIPSDSNEVLTIGELAFNRTKTEQIVYLSEGNEFVPYIVLSNDYSNSTLLLRLNVLGQEHPINDYSSYYENSQIDCYLNDEFILLFSDSIQQSIINTSIDIVSEKSIGICGEGTTAISRKIFLLSFSELGYSPSGYTPYEGKVLDYFDIPENRIATDDAGKRRPWWLRTADTSYYSCTFAVGPEAEIGSTDTFFLNGVRPALRLPSETMIELANLPGKEQKCYVIAEQ